MDPESRRSNMTEISSFYISSCKYDTRIQVCHWKKQKKLMMELLTMQLICVKWRKNFESVSRLFDRRNLGIVIGGCYLPIVFQTVCIGRFYRIFQSLI
jgi:hypothetical protein